MKRSEMMELLNKMTEDELNALDEMLYKCNCDVEEYFGVREEEQSHDNEDEDEDEYEVEEEDEEEDEDMSYLTEYDKVAEETDEEDEELPF